MSRILQAGRVLSAVGAAARTHGVRISVPSFRALSVSTLKNPKVKAFVDKYTKLCLPDNVEVLDGSPEENQRLLDLLEKQGTIKPLNQEKRPGSYIAWTDPADVARAEADTFICSENKSDCGPTNNWRNPEEQKEMLTGRFFGCMKGRTMYVIPFSMGPIGSPLSKLGLEVTDSAYVAASMRIMTRVGSEALELIEETGEFVPCVHSVGQPILPAEECSAEDYEQARSAWPCNIKKRSVNHFPSSREIMSFGSGYGGNSLLGKKCFALRIASIQARDEGWLAEHMLILGVTPPNGEKIYMAAAFPSACGKTNLAMMLPKLEGWKIEVVGDDIAWMKRGADGHMYAINPEYGFFGVAPGTSMESNPNAMVTCESNSMFTNVGLTEDGDVYWEGMDELPEGKIMDWKKNENWQPTLVTNNKGEGTGYKGLGYKVNDKVNPAAQANSRFTCPITQCPVLDENWNSPQGVPISAIVFGGRRDDTIPLVHQSYDWAHGTFIGATMRSNATSAADQKGTVNDPMAMKPFIGYNVKHYLQHWLDVGKTGGSKMPSIFQVNWFQKDESGFIWPGYGDNIRVLEWIYNRCQGKATDAQETPIGYVPNPNTFNIDGVDITKTKLKKILKVDNAKWTSEIEDINHYFQNVLCTDEYPDPVPEELQDQLNELSNRLNSRK